MDYISTLKLKLGIASTLLSRAKACMNFISELDKVEIDFSMTCAPIITNASLVTRLIISYDYCGRVDSIITRAEKKAGISFIGYQKGCNVIVAPVSAIQEYQCPACYNTMTVDVLSAKISCSNQTCGVVRALIGAASDEFQSTGKSLKQKGASFDPNRHFTYWWTHILARESTDELGDGTESNMSGEALIEEIKTVAIRKGYVLKMLTIDNVRAILKIIKKTKLNKNAALILKLITGIGPPEVGIDFERRAENLFTKSTETNTAICRERSSSFNKVNKNYYPGYIARIVLAITTDKDSELRRLLYYIHVQSEETVIADDNDWKQICLAMGEIKYAPFDRNIGNKYGPSTYRKIR
jgi:hypothetical protein